MDNEALYAAVSAELLAGHPVTGAYPVGTDADDTAALAQINLANVVRDRPTIPATEILEIIIANPGEWNALTASEQTMVSMILDLNPSVPTAAGSPARTALVAILGAATVAAIGAAIPETVSQATALGLPVIIIGDIQNARAL
jgi:hypothetical protein